MPSPSELREEKGRLAKKAQDILDEAEEEERDLTADEEERFDEIHERIEALNEKIERRERQASVDAEVAEATAEEEQRMREEANRPDPTPEQESTEYQEEREQDVRRAFTDLIAFGWQDIGEEQREILNDYEVRGARTPEARAQSAGTDSSGGFTVPEPMADQIVTALQSFGGMRRAPTRQFMTESGDTLKIPEVDDTSNTGEIVSENSSGSEQDVTFANTDLSTYMYTSKEIRVSVELTQDTKFDLVSYLEERIVERIGRITNQHFTTGSGGSQPNGVVTAATDSGETFDGTTAFDYDTVVSLKHSVDPAYRRRDAAWMMSDAGLLEMKKIKDGNGNPIWSPGLTADEPDTIDGDPYVVNQDVADPGTSNKSLLYGDWSNYWIRDVMAIRVFRQGPEDDRDLRRNMQVAVEAFIRTGGNLVDAGTNPIQYATNASS